MLGKLDCAAHKTQPIGPTFLGTAASGRAGRGSAAAACRPSRPVRPNPIGGQQGRATWVTATAGSIWRGAL